jgi:hypothetical protein
MLDNFDYKLTSYLLLSYNIFLRVWNNFLSGDIS